MKIPDAESCRADLDKTACVQFLGVPWTLRMVAAINGQSETTVRSNLAQGISLASQLRKPVRGTKTKRSRDLNKTPPHVILHAGDIEWSWQFIAFIEYMADPGSVVRNPRRASSNYQYYLSSANTKHNTTTFLRWARDYVAEVNPRLQAAAYGTSGEDMLAILTEYMEAFRKFDRNKLKNTNDVLPTYMYAPGWVAVDDERMTYLRTHYVDVLHLLPREHLKDAVTTMLQQGGDLWLNN